MKSLYNYIIETDSRYNNEVEVGDKSLLINTEITERDAEFVNRVGKIIACPSALGTPAKVGDEIIVHHNVFRRWYDVRQNEKNSGYYLNNNQFFAYPDQAFAYKRDGEWRGFDGYCFVEPVFEETTWDKYREIPLRGILRYTNSHLEEAGLKPGDLVGFTPESEYAFRIDGKVLYRIYSYDITMKHEYKGEKTADTFSS